MTPDSLVVRRKRSSDDAAIAAISREGLSEYTPRAHERTLGMTRRRGAITLVVAGSRAPLGFAVLQLEGGRGAHLNAIAIHESIRGRGVGRVLLGHVEDVARSRRVRKLRLATASANVAALQLFLAAGYRIERRIAHYYERGQDAVALGKSI